MKRTQPEPSSSDEPTQQEESGENPVEAITQPPCDPGIVSSEPDKRVKLTDPHASKLAPHGGTEQTVNAGPEDPDGKPADKDGKSGDSGEAEEEDGFGGLTDIQKQEQGFLETLTTENCLSYWQQADEHQMPLLNEACRLLTNANFYSVTASSDLLHLPVSVMRMILEADEVDIQFESDMAEVLIQWVDSDEGRSTSCLELFKKLRWSGLDAHFVRRRLLAHPRSSANPDLHGFFVQVVDYLTVGSPFPGLITKLRPMTGRERCIVIVGVDRRTTLSPDVIRVSLERSEASVRGQVPTTMRREAAACVWAATDILYVSGIGNGMNEIWQWSGAGGWTRCANMTVGRRRHSMVFAQEASLYLIAGFAGLQIGRLKSVEKYDTRRGICSPVGNLLHAVESAASVADRNILYVLGGGDESRNPVSHVQAFNTANNTCYTLEPGLPHPAKDIRAVVWDRMVLVIGPDACLVYDIEKGQWFQRPEFIPRRVHFGCVIEDEQLFIFGGAKRLTDSATGISNWTLFDDILHLPVADIIDNKPVQWMGFTNFRLPMPCLVHAYGTITVSSGGRRQVV